MTLLPLLSAVLGLHGAALADPGPENAAPPVEEPAVEEAAVEEPPDEGAPDTGEATPPSPSPLDRAVRLYQLGRFDEAKSLLAQLVLEEAGVEAAVRQTARVYLAELLFTEGDRGGAEIFFRKALAEDPTLQLDPFRHPPDVIGFFNYVRALADAERVPAEPPPPEPVAAPPALQPVPLTVWMPLGVYHFQEGLPARGATWLTTQAALFGFSFVSFGLLVADHTAPTGSAELTRLQNLRTANRVTAVASAGVWALSVVDAQLHWRRTHPRPQAVRVGAAPAAGGGTVAARLRF